jgi:hypothetical protein
VFLGSSLSPLPVLFIMLFPLAVVATQERHDETRRPSKEISLKEELDFAPQKNNELYPGRSNELKQEAGEFKIQWGTVKRGEGRAEAVRVYRGRALEGAERFVTAAGRAKTYRAARKKCEELVPLGKWRISLLMELIKFGGPILSKLRMSSNETGRSAYPFWVQPMRQTKETEREDFDVFAVIADGSGPDPEEMSYRELLSRLRELAAQKGSEDQVSSVKKVLSQMEEGVPVICTIETPETNQPE